MKASIFSVIAMILSASAQQASAFSQDDESLNDAQGQARFSDPDERTPGGMFQFQGSQDTGSVDPYSVRYDYDPASGGYIPRRR